MPIPYLSTDTVTLYHGDALSVLRTLPSASADECVTSPPYFALRDYGVAGQIGIEPTPEEYCARLVEVFREVRRVLTGAGTLWLNVGDTYNTSGGVNNNGKNPALGKTARPPQLGRLVGLKQKDLIGVPWMLAFALRADGWFLRAENIWHKPNKMPDGAPDRPTVAHEQIFLFSKSAKYYYDREAITEQAGSSRGKRNRRTVWTVPTTSFSGAHFAVFPPALIELCIKAGCPEGGTVLDPFSGSGTTLAVADKLRRKAVGIELNSEYCAMHAPRLARPPLLSGG